MKFSKNVTNKKQAPNLIFFNEKNNCERFGYFLAWKLDLKVRNQHFLIAWFRAEVDLPKNVFMKKCYFPPNNKLPFDAEAAERILKVI